MKTVQVSHLEKSFGSTQAVADVSFAVEQGEIFGWLGPNGAGKTTTIRMMLDILQPDRGEVEVLGGPMTEATKNRIGYLPEERGLYQDLRLEQCLVYLATLKGLPEGEARRRVRGYLERFDLAAHADKKIKTLSKAVEQCEHGPVWQKRTTTSPQDIAEGIAFLCSEAGRFITGCELPYDFR